MAYFSRVKTNQLVIQGTALTSTPAELNILDGVTATYAELNYLDITTLGSLEASKALTASATGVCSIGTNAAKLTLTASAPRLTLNCTSAITTGQVQAMSVNTTLTGAQAARTTEAFRSVVTSAVTSDDWINAVVGKIDFSTAGAVVGRAGAVCGEIDLNSTGVNGGHYSAFQAELNVPTNAVLGTDNATSFYNGNAWGAGVATWQTSGYIFEFTGLGTAAAGHVFDTCTATAASHALRIMIDGVNYYIMMNDNVDA